MPRASRHNRRPSADELLHQLDFVGALQVGDGAETALRQSLLGRRPDAEDETNRPVRQHRARFFLVERGKTARLVEVGGDLGQKLVARQPDGNRDADVALDLAGEAGQNLGGDHAVNALGAGKIQKRFVDRERFDQRRQCLHGMTHLASDPDIFGHVGPDHDRGRAQRERFEHRHCRAHPEGPGDVARRRYHAALAAADDDRLVGEFRVVALLDGRVERVAIDVGERQ